MWDAEANEPRMPNGSIGDRWANEHTGRWNLELRDSVLDGDLYIFTHAESRDAIENRYRAMMAAQEKAEKRERVG